MSNTPEHAESDTPRADSVVSAINATLKPYSGHLSTATAMLLVGIYQDIHNLERELINAIETKQETIERILAAIKKEQE